MVAKTIRYGMSVVMHVRRNQLTISRIVLISTCSIQIVLRTEKCLALFIRIDFVQFYFTTDKHPETGFKKSKGSAKNFKSNKQQGARIA